jgi:general L-amino acid transport system substrate-binding protein
MLAGPCAASTLDDVRQRGTLRCGISSGLLGFALPDKDGHWHGLDVDFCRAVAAAVLGDAKKVDFVPLTARSRFSTLREGKIDVLAHNTTWTLERDVDQGVSFVGVNYYDGQGFLARKSLGVRSALQLDGATICVQTETTSETNVKQYFVLNRMGYRIVPSETPQATIRAYEAGECDVVTSDQSQLYALRSQLADPEASLLLPEVISKEPLGPVVREGDEQWFKIARWTLFTMIDAEERKIGSQNVERVRAQAQDPAVRRFLGVEGGPGKQLGLGNRWAYNILKQVGNYGESFARNLGRSSALEIGRGLNALWREGGLLYAPPAF